MSAEHPGGVNTAAIRELLCVRYDDGTEITVAQYDLDKVKWHGPNINGEIYTVERTDGRVENFRRWIAAWTWERPAKRGANQTG